MSRIWDYELGYTFWGQDVILYMVSINYELKTVRFDVPCFSTYKKNRMYQMPFPYMEKPDYNSFIQFMVNRIPFELEYFEGAFGKRMVANGEQNSSPHKYAEQKGLMTDEKCTWEKVLTSLPPEAFDETLLESIFDTLVATEGRKRYYEDSPEFDSLYRGIVSKIPHNNKIGREGKVEDIMYLRPVCDDTGVADIVTDIIGNVRAALRYGREIAGSNGFKEDSIRLTWFPDYDPVNHWIKIRRKMNYISAFRELRYVYMGRLDVAERLIKDGKFTEEELLDTLEEEITLLPLKLKRCQLKRFRQCFVNC